MPRVQINLPDSVLASGQSQEEFVREAKLLMDLVVEVLPLCHETRAQVLSLADEARSQLIQALPEECGPFDGRDRRERDWLQQLSAG